MIRTLDPDARRDHDSAALARCDLFLFSAVATVLVVRTALAVTGYPQVGGGGLHIAHVLWGGLFMVIAIIMVELLPGSRARLSAAFVGGIGFGLFIDEVGKFITDDVDYFFKPAVAIMYAVFVVLYLGVRVFVTLLPMTDRRRLALASQALADLALDQLDRARLSRALALLENIGPDSDLAEPANLLREALHSAPPSRPGFDAKITRQLDRLQDAIARVLTTPLVLRIVIAVFAAHAISLIVDLVIVAFRQRDVGLAHALWDTGVPTLVVGVLTATGIGWLLLRSRSPVGLDLLEWSVIVDLLFVQVAVFNREQWLGLVGFAVSVAMLTAVRLGRRSGALLRSIPGVAAPSGVTRHWLTPVASMSCPTP